MCFEVVEGRSQRQRSHRTSSVKVLDDLQVSAGLHVQREGVLTLSSVMQDVLKEEGCCGADLTFELDQSQDAGPAQGQTRASTHLDGQGAAAHIRAPWWLP